MSAEPVQQLIAPAEYLARERAAEYRSEYISGEVIAMSGASARHGAIVVNLIGQLYSALRGKPCKPMGGNLRVRVRAANYLYPDLTIICGEAQFADGEHLDTLLNPTVIFEILSDTTESKDRGIKWRLYQQIESLEHYVIIDQSTARVEVHTPHADVDWLMHIDSGINATFTLPAVGLSVALADLYEDVALQPDILAA